MNYDAFKGAFLEALAESRLPIMGMAPAKEELDLRSMDRTCTVYIQPLARDANGSFHVSGEITWRWNTLHTARTATTEEDLLAELLGHSEADVIETNQPRLRVDIKIRAGLDYGKSLPMPAETAWATWSREAMGRLERIERLVAEEISVETEDGLREILAWQGNPEIAVTCTPAGELRMESIEVSAFQIVRLPRKWDNTERADDGPYDQLAAMFARVKAALFAWGDVMYHLE